MYNRRPSRFYSYHYFSFHSLEKLDLPPALVGALQEKSVSTIAELERALPELAFLGIFGPPASQDILNKINAYRLSQLNGTPIDQLELTSRMNKALNQREISTIEELHANLYRLADPGRIQKIVFNMILDHLDIWQSAVAVPNHRNTAGLPMLRSKPEPETPLRALRLSGRTENALLRADISSIEDLQGNLHRLNYLRTVGPRTINEIESRLAEWRQHPVGQKRLPQTHQNLANLLQSTLLADLDLLKQPFQTVEFGRDATVYDLMAHILKYPGLYMNFFNTKKRRKMEAWLREHGIDIRSAYWVVESRLWMRRNQPAPLRRPSITQPTPQGIPGVQRPPGYLPTPAQSFQQAFEKLPQRTQFVLERLYGLRAQEPQGETLQAVSKPIGVTRERVRQIRNNGLKQLSLAIPYRRFELTARIVEHIRQQNGLISSKQLAGRLQDSFASSGYLADGVLRLLAALEPDVTCHKIYYVPDVGGWTDTIETRELVLKLRLAIIIHLQTYPHASWQHTLEALHQNPEIAPLDSALAEAVARCLKDANLMELERKADWV
jgi:hypothetical protein